VAVATSPPYTKTSQLRPPGKTRKQGDLAIGKIDNSGGGLIKSAFARFLERAIINGRNRTIFEISTFWTILG
jgi:hypothetical protein